MVANYYVWETYFVPLCTEIPGAVCASSGVLNARSIPVQISRRTFRRSVVRRLNERVAHERRFGPPAIAIISISSKARSGNNNGADGKHEQTKRRRRAEAAAPAQRERARGRYSALPLSLALASLPLFSSLLLTLSPNNPLPHHPLALQRRRQSADCAGAATVYAICLALLK